jgi:hypothetical protein
MKRTKYVVLSDKESSLNWEESIISSLGICHTFSKAYEIALFISGITQPDIKYRKALETIKQKGAIQIRSKLEHEPGAVIATVKIY